MGIPWEYPEERQMREQMEQTAYENSRAHACDWSTDLAAAPRGEDVLVAIKTISGEGEALTQIGMLIWEPYAREDDETDDDCDGYFGEHSGEMGVWYWHCGEDGYTDKKHIAAWREMPPAFVQE